MTLCKLLAFAEINRDFLKSNAFKIESNSHALRCH